AVQLGLDAESHRDDGVAVEGGGKLLLNPRPTETQQSLDSARAQNLVKSPHRQSRRPQPQGFQPITDLAGAGCHAFVDTREVGGAFPRPLLVVERDDAETRAFTPDAWFAQVTHHVDDARIGLITVLGGEGAHASLGCRGNARTV